MFRYMIYICPSYIPIFPLGPTRHLSSYSSFLFSIYNPSNTAPLKLEVIADQNASAIYTDEELGPTFGKNYDLKIASPQSSSSLGTTYRRPPEISADAADSFFASTPSFTVDEIEVFYAYGKLLTSHDIL